MNTILEESGIRIIRIYNEKGEHILSVVDEPAFCVNIDLATPDGNVEYCGVPNDLFNTLSKHFIVEKE